MVESLMEFVAAVIFQYALPKIEVVNGDPVQNYENWLSKKLSSPKNIDLVKFLVSFLSFLNFF